MEPLRAWLRDLDPMQGLGRERVGVIWVKHGEGGDDEHRLQPSVCVGQREHGDLAEVEPVASLEVA